MTCAGFPHSDISGSTLVCNSPELFAAYHVLHRLLTPRHPPFALTSLIQKGIESFRANEDALPRSLFDCQRSMKTPASRRTSGPTIPHAPSGARLHDGGDNRDRTGNLRLAKPALSQLSYIPAIPDPVPGRNMVGLGRVELPTSRLSGVRSNQLSYRP